MGTKSQITNVHLGSQLRDLVRGVGRTPIQSQECRCLLHVLQFPESYQRDELHLPLVGGHLDFSRQRNLAHLALNACCDGVTSDLCDIVGHNVDDVVGFAIGTQAEGLTPFGCFVENKFLVHMVTLRCQSDAEAIMMLRCHGSSESWAVMASPGRTAAAQHRCPADSSCGAVQLPSLREPYETVASFVPFMSYPDHWLSILGASVKDSKAALPFLHILFELNFKSS